MTTNPPAKSNKAWKPGDPLRLDKAIQQNPANKHIADQLERSADALVTQVNHAARTVKPTNHKPFNRQKKG